MRYYKPLTLLPSSHPLRLAPPLPCYSPFALPPRLPLAPPVSSLRSVGGLSHTWLVSDVGTIVVSLVGLPRPSITSTTASEQGEDSGDQQCDSSGKDQPDCIGEVSRATSLVVVDGVSDEGEDSKVKDETCERYDER